MDRGRVIKTRADRPDIIAENIVIEYPGRADIENRSRKNAEEVARPSIVIENPIVENPVMEDPVLEN